MCAEYLDAMRGAVANHNTKGRPEFCGTVKSSYDVKSVVKWDAKIISKLD